MNRRFAFASALLLALSALPALPATFFVPMDRSMVQRAGAIITGTVLSSYTERTALGGIETVSTISVDEVI